MIKSTPIPHDCGRVLDVKWVSKTRVNYNCAICGELVAWSDIDPDVKVKVYPSERDSTYNEDNLKSWA